MRKKVLENYVQAYVPDKDDLAYLVTEAKGPNRSMSEFARVCNVKSASTFSRIVNKLIDKPVSDELLLAVAERSVDAQVTLDKLLRANGKIPRSEMKGTTPTLGDRKIYKARAEKVMEIKDILVDHYLSIGDPVKIYPETKVSEIIPTGRFGLLLQSDFILQVDGVGQPYWNFFVDFTELYGISLKDPGVKDGTFLAETMRRLSPLFLRDAWEPESLGGFKNTIIFTEQTAYSAFRILMHGTHCNTPISAMYIDDEEGYIDMEFDID